MIELPPKYTMGAHRRYWFRLLPDECSITLDSATNARRIYFSKEASKIVYDSGYQYVTIFTDENDNVYIRFAADGRYHPVCSTQRNLTINNLGIVSAIHETLRLSGTHNLCRIAIYDDGTPNCLTFQILKYDL